MFIRMLALFAIASLSVIAGARADQWDGYYIGLHAGYGASESDATRKVNNAGYFAASSVTALESASAMALDEETFLGGAQFGVNWGMGAVIVGLEVDASGFGNDASKAATVTYPCCGPTTFTTSASLEQAWLATARLRLALPTEFALFYVTGGYAGSDVKFTQTFSDTFFPIPRQTIETSEFMSGWSAGGGVEFMMEPGASLRVEYLYLDLGDIEATGPIANGASTSNGLAAVSDQMVRVGLNFQMD